MEQWVFINQDFLPEPKAVLHINDLAFQRAYGIFDFFGLVQSRPLYLNEHLDRFFYSAARMRLPVYYNRNEITLILEEFISKNKLTDEGIRITLTGGYSLGNTSTGTPNFIINHYRMPSYPGTGVNLITYPHARQLPEIKTIDYIMSIWLMPLLQEKKAGEVLYYQNGLVSECSRSNFLMVTENDTIVTPSIRILKGITRQKIIEAAAGKFEVQERDLALTEIYTAREAFITSTSKKLLPVKQIDDYILPSENKITKKLKSAISEMGKKDFY